MSDTETRDIAMQAKILIDHHMLDCSTFREGLRSDMKAFNDDLKKLNNRVMMIIGAIVLVTHGVDWIIQLLDHK